ncbi:cell division protein FtsA [Candidatus Dojkabacteria bacterium]|nr:cell division protein FtsA [Candidatus Dojkabacteria bacterium]
MANNIVAALDVGSSKINAIIATLEEGKLPNVIGVATYPSKGLKKGVIVNIEEAINSVAEAIEAAERMAGLTISSVYVSINGKHITSTNNRGVVAVAQDEIVTDDIFRAIESARTVSIPPSREILHVIPRQFSVDTQGGIKDPVGMSGTRLEVDAHIISATTTALHNLVKVVQQLGLKVDDIVFSGWAASSAVLTNTEKELGVMLLDIGGGTTSITTFVEDAITYSGSVPFGGSNVTSDLAIGLRISIEDAEKIKVNADELSKITKEKKKSSTKSKDEKEDEKKKSKEKEKSDLIDVSSLNIEGTNTLSKKLFDEIIEARLSEIFDLVLSQVEQSRNEARLPAGIVITGGSSLLPNVTSIAKKVFGVPARVGYPKGLEGLVDEINNPAYSVGQGLILYASQDEWNMGGAMGLREGPSKRKGGGIFKGISGFFKNLMP